jgi:carboxylate-amine ligase
MGERSVGVEEEFLLVDPENGRVREAAARALGVASRDPGVEVEAELQLQQIETSTEPCETLADLQRQLHRGRQWASEAARAVGVEIAALATSPLPADTTITPSLRYQRMRERFGLLAEEQLTCGCHIHVGVESDEEAVAVLDRLRPWLAPLVALSANSPFWDGRDSRYASYRSRVWSRWPSAGPTELFGSARAYHETVRSMIETGTVLDRGMVYFDVRLSERYPTVEVRVADVGARVDDAVLLAALARALVGTAAREWRDGVQPCPARLELLRLAAWRASRDGLGGELLDPMSGRPAPARQVLDGLLDHVRDALEDAGELAEVRERYVALLRRGNGAWRQRGVYAETGSLAEVVHDAVRHTLR